MAYIDYIIISIVSVGILVGFIKGYKGVVIKWVSIMLSIVFALFTSKAIIETFVVKQFIHQVEVSLNIDTPYKNIIIYIIIGAFVWLVVWFMFKIMSKYVKINIKGILNNVVGGFALGGLVLMLFQVVWILVLRFDQYHQIQFLPELLSESFILAKMDIMARLIIRFFIGG